MERITEMPSPYRDLESKTVEELVGYINAEDHRVAPAIKQALPRLIRLIEQVVSQLQAGGRLLYVGAGSGGRLSVLDVIELPTTYGVEKGAFNVILAGGVDRLADAMDEKEDDRQEAWRGPQDQQAGKGDVLIGMSASGTTPVVLEALKACRNEGIPTGCIVNNPGSPIAAVSDFPVEVITGPEFITGSTRMKSGTAQKMVFDIISTTTMVRLGRVEDNSMVHVALINDKITDRAVRMLMEKGGIGHYEEAKTLLLKAGSVSKALDERLGV